jgi:hypothetical protein
VWWDAHDVIQKHKLKKMWSVTPFDDVDCRIEKWPSVKSFCVNVGWGKKIPY